METEKIIQVQEELKQLGINEIKHNADAAEKFKRLYKVLYPDSDLCTTCPGKLERAYHRVRKLSPINIKNMNERKYHLKKGTLLDFWANPIAGVPAQVTDDNLTDEYAELILAKNGSYAAQFITTEGPKKVKAAPQKAAENISAPVTDGKVARFEEVSLQMTKKQIIDALTAIQKKNKALTFDPKDTKDNLAQLLIDNE